MTQNKGKFTLYIATDMYQNSFFVYSYSLFLLKKWHKYQ